MSTLALLSGGLDSTTATTYTEAAEAVFVDYGQRHIREYRSAQAIAHWLDIPLHRLDLRAYGASVTSALTRANDPNTPAVPHGHYEAASMALTVVPNRNAVLLSAAAGIAASHGHDEVVTAVHAGDHAIYPDCRPDFITALDAATRLACGVGISAPFLRWSKQAIASLAADLDVPIAATWSCYEGGIDQPLHCGRCGTCVERAEAIASAGIPDPTGYADPDFWRETVSA